MHTVKCTEAGNVSNIQVSIDGKKTWRDYSDILASGERFNGRILVSLEGNEWTTVKEFSNLENTNKVKKIDFDILLNIDNMELNFK